MTEKELGQALAPVVNAILRDIELKLEDSASRANRANTFQMYHISNVSWERLKKDIRGKYIKGGNENDGQTGYRDDCQDTPRRRLGGPGVSLCR